MSAETAGRALAGVIAVALVVALVLRSRLRSAHDDRAGGLSAGAASPAERGASNDGNPYVGVVLSERTVDVVAHVDGLVIDLTVKLGQRVAAGDVVSRVDVPKLQHELATATAAERASAVEIARAQAEVTETERLVAYKEKLLAASVGSEEELEAARYQRKVAKLRVDQSRTKLEEQHGRVAELQRDREASNIR